MHNLWIFRKHFLLNMDKNNKKIGQLRFFCKNKILEQNQDKKIRNGKDKSSEKNIARYNVTCTNLTVNNTVIN